MRTVLAGSVRGLELSACWVGKNELPVRPADVMSLCCQLRDVIHSKPRCDELCSVDGTLTRRAHLPRAQACHSTRVARLRWHYFSAPTNARWLGTCVKWCGFEHRSQARAMQAKRQICSPFMHMLFFSHPDLLQCKMACGVTTQGERLQRMTSRAVMLHRARQWHCASCWDTMQDSMGTYVQLSDSPSTRMAHTVRNLPHA